MREKLDDDDDVYKELVYISLESKRCFCVFALFCVFVSSNPLFFSHQLFRDDINCRV